MVRSGEREVVYAVLLRSLRCRPRKGGDPVITVLSVCTGSPACAGDDTERVAVFLLLDLIPIGIYSVPLKSRASSIAMLDEGAGAGIPHIGGRMERREV